MYTDGLVKSWHLMQIRLTKWEKKRIATLPSKDITKSSTISTFEDKDEIKSHYLESFWNPSSSKSLDTSCKLYVVNMV